MTPHGCPSSHWSRSRKALPPLPNPNKCKWVSERAGCLRAIVGVKRDTTTWWGIPMQNAGAKCVILKGITWSFDQMEYNKAQIQAQVFNLSQKIGREKAQGATTSIYKFWLPKNSGQFHPKNCTTIFSWSSHFVVSWREQSRWPCEYACLYSFFHNACSSFSFKKL